MHISISFRSGARGFKHFAIFKWCNRMGKQVHFTDYIEKYFNQKLSKIKFSSKTLLSGCTCQSLPVVEPGASKYLSLLKHNALV